GCGALHIGEQLSQHYGIPFYTRKNLLELAQNRGVLQEMDDFFEERPVDELMFAISQFDEEPQNVNVKAFSVLSQLIGHEDCIIIG
ncbi:MAG: cytidylate kinase family protein, partial [Prevotella sp.]|nr:cytidylate kinase family protein [Prevotella sp.]